MTERDQAAVREETDRRPICLLTSDDLRASLRPLLAPPAVIVCIGSELHGDDGAGVAVGRELAGQVPWFVIEASLAPESFVVKIADYRPNAVMVIDAVDFGAPPGSVALIDVDRIACVAAGTHGPSLLPFIEALQMMHRCEVIVLGIQPMTTRTGDGLSPPVGQAVSRVAAAFRALADDGSWTPEGNPP